jgi:hypothetical protein
MLTHVYAAGLNSAQASRDTGKASNKHTAIRNSRGGGGAVAAAPERTDGLQVLTNQFICFSSTKVQILTPEELLQRLASGGLGRSHVAPVTRSNLAATLLERSTASSDKSTASSASDSKSTRPWLQVLSFLAFLVQKYKY